MANYAENMYHWLKRKGYAQQFEHPGIYKISIDGIVAYIGKSDNMLWRLAQHYTSLRSGDTAHKYQILREAKQREHRVTFEVLCYAKSKSKDDLEEELGAAEGYYIRKFRPLLNTQIPKESDWRKYDYNAAAVTVTLEEILAATTRRF